MASALTKIIKPVGEQPDALEVKIAEALIDLENSSDEIRKELRPVQITSAKEIELGHGRKAIAVFVPVPLIKQVHKVQSRVVRELEKKFSDRHVIIIAQRRILPRETRKSRSKQPRPRNRTLAAVHDAILDDLVYPAEIIGKRLRVKVDGSRQIKVFLDRKDMESVEYKVDTFSSVYKKLTGKEVVFDFPAAQMAKEQ
ncbi:ribosomal protein S7e [Rozella allomycis CSF55]|uniref:40S ribosomal protein S7 n=1 Tax=Rozella allomycis (strain CSF55) TaxID=988480 RepID=A0A075B2U8_ROZAC|nr:40S ribosomal protein S7 [Rozella allomycis CSF55]RKP19920.1 ribosomal protein S7e [Rozella allomycis CSF55]|eukprot:EPZ35301.1 40S ribosomal protein S7 [Rozella allomycis CSF55]